MMKSAFFEEKTFSSSKIASLPNWEGAKYAGGSRPSGFYTQIKSFPVFHFDKRCMRFVFMIIIIPHTENKYFNY